MSDYVVFAYIDPGTGSYVLQMALAGMLGAGYAVRRFWSQIKGLFSRGRADGEGRGDDAAR
jgi:hypothetical protein